MKPPPLYRGPFIERAAARQDDIPSVSQLKRNQPTNHHHHHHHLRRDFSPSDVSASCLFFEAIPGIPYGKGDNDLNRRLSSSSISSSSSSGGNGSRLRGSYLPPPFSLNAADAFD